MSAGYSCFRRFASKFSTYFEMKYDAVIIARKAGTFVLYLPDWVTSAYMGKKTARNIKVCFILIPTSFGQ